MKNAFVVLLAGMVVTPAIATAAPKNTLPACQAFVDAWQAAYNKKDARALAGMYDATAGSYSNSFWTASGREALTQAFGQEVGTGSRMTAIKCDASQQIDDVSLSKGTYAAMSPGPDGKIATFGGHWLATAVQRGDHYFILSHVANIQLPTPGK